MQSIKVPMCQKRCNVLIEAFKNLDIDQNGLIDFQDLKQWFKNNGYSLRKNVYMEENINERVIFPNIE